MSWSHPGFLISVPCPPRYVLFTLFLCSLALLHYRTFLRSSMRTGYLLIFLMLIISMLRTFFIPKTARFIIEQDTTSLAVICEDNTTIIIDSGTIHRASSIPSFVTYVVLPELRRRLGSDRIDYIVLCKPSPISATLAHSLIKSHGTILLPKLFGTRTPKMERMYQALQHLDALVHELKAPYALTKSVTIVPGEMIKYSKQCSYPELHVEKVTA